MADAPRRQLRFESFDDVFAEVDRLAVAERERRLARHGSWTLGQAVNHIAGWAEFAYTGAPTPTSPRWLKLLIRPFRGRLLRISLKPGFKFRNVPGGTLVTEVVETSPAIDRLRRVLHRMEREPPARPNGLLGPLTHAQWKQLQLRHAELHLSFFSVQVNQRQ